MHSQGVLSLGDVRKFIDKSMRGRQVNKIQHSFPSPRYWRERDVPVESVLQDRQKLIGAGPGSTVNLYMGVPYCIKTVPDRCGYCLFPVEHFAGHQQLDEYFGYIEREVAMYRDAMQGATLGAVYFGGGTSNLYKADKYPELMRLVREMFPTIHESVDLTLEGIPQLFTREKLKAIREAGMNRISQGVQQLNEELNKLSGRKQTKAQVLQTLEWAREFGLSCNVDIIFGWPRQTVGSMLADLKELVQAGAYDITHYELNVGGPTDFALNRYHELPSTLANLEMYRESRDYLRSEGYEQITAYNWRKPGDPVGRSYEEGVTRRFASMDTLGIGYAAITFFGDVSLGASSQWSYINHPDIAAYKSAIDGGRFPVAYGFHHDPEDFRLAMLFRNLFGLSVDRSAYREAFQIDPYEEFEVIWQGLAERDFVRVEPERIEVIGDGVFFTPLIQTLLAQTRYPFLRERVSKETRDVLLPISEAEDHA